MKFKYRFEILYEPAVFKKALEFLQAFDFEIQGVGIKHILTFESVDDIPIFKIKENITEAYKSMNLPILRIQGGKVE